MGSRGFRNEIRGTHQCPLGSVASYLICADVRTLGWLVVMTGTRSADGATPDAANCRRGQKWNRATNARVAIRGAFVKTKERSKLKQEQVRAAQ